MTKRQHKPKKTARTSQKLSHSQSVPFIEHVHELKRRFLVIAISILLFGGITYAIEHKVIAALLLPAKGQQFIYTSPGGGIDFLFRVCIYAGIALSIPVIVYQILKYIEPLIRTESARFIAIGSLVSGILALGGMVFGYFVGLPNALHFLLHQFTTQQIRPLVTIQSYMAFVSVYMLGSALLFQAPLILLFINRVKPLKPSGLIKGERWVVLVAFVGAGLMNPTPNIFAQLLVAGPLILMYQVGILLIWLVNRRPRKSSAVAELLARDAEVQAERLVRLAQRPVVTRTRPVPMPLAAVPQPLKREAKFVNDFGRPRPTRTFASRRYA
jgi:sec-independent protein translocase protein TatC